MSKYVGVQFPLIAASGSIGWKFGRVSPTHLDATRWERGLELYNEMRPSILHVRHAKIYINSEVPVEKLGLGYLRYQWIEVRDVGGRFSKSALLSHLCIRKVD